MLRTALIGVLAAMPAAAIAQDAAPAAPATTALHCERLFDARAGRVLGPHTVVVREGRIAEVLQGRANVPGAATIDLAGHTCSPGWTDLHVHLDGESSPDSYSEGFRLDPVDFAFRSVGYARKTLEAGFTTVVDLGAANEAIFALREAVRRGDVAGPNIIASGSSVSVHGGHGDINGYRDDIMHLLSPESVCSGPEDCRRAVRLQVRAGADIIKITATGGVLSNTAAGLAQQFTQDELASIVEVAHRMGRQVTAHAHGADGINAFLAAGGDSIEHGTYLDDDSIRLFRQHDAIQLARINVFPVSRWIHVEAAGRGQLQKTEVRARLAEIRHQLK